MDDCGSQSFTFTPNDKESVYGSAELLNNNGANSEDLTNGYWECSQSLDSASACLKITLLDGTFEFGKIKLSIDGECVDNDNCDPFVLLVRGDSFITTFNDWDCGMNMYWNDNSNTNGGIAVSPSNGRNSLNTVTDKLREFLDDGCSFDECCDDDGFRAVLGGSDGSNSGSGTMLQQTSICSAQTLQYSFENNRCAQRLNTQYQIGGVGAAASYPASFVNQGDDLEIYIFPAEGQTIRFNSVTVDFDCAIDQPEDCQVYENTCVAWGDPHITVKKVALRLLFCFGFFLCMTSVCMLWYVYTCI